MLLPAQYNQIIILMFELPMAVYDLANLITYKLN